MPRNDPIELDRRHLVHPVSSRADHEAAGARVSESGRGLYLTEADLLVSRLRNTLDLVHPRTGEPQ